MAFGETLRTLPLSLLVPRHPEPGRETRISRPAIAAAPAE
jgi:hypothetical protein